MTDKTKEMIMSEDLEMVNLGLTILQEEQPDMVELVKLVKCHLQSRFFCRVYTDIFSGEQRVVVGRNYEDETYLFVKDPTKQLKIIP